MWVKAVKIIRLSLGTAVLTADMEVKLVPNVGGAWISVSLDNTYSSAVVVCSYNLPSAPDPSATTRVRNVTATSFQVRVQHFENSSLVTASDVHCTIVDEGAYNIPGGPKFEAHRVNAPNTAGLSVPGNWGIGNNVEVTGSISQAYASPVVLGQVMSFNDAKASVFWTYNCVSRGVPPFQANGRICVGKHIGQINGTRLSETIGYIVVDSRKGTLNDIVYEAALGGNSIRGIRQGPPFNYVVSDNFDIGTVSQNGENGGQGGWAVLFGNDPLLPSQLSLGIDEETVAGDVNRGHIAEQVSYWVFRDNQTVALNTNKQVIMSSVSFSPYAIPGSDVEYSINVSNTGSKSVDTNSIVIIDKMPSEAVFYNGDIDDGGPLTGVVNFVDNGSGLTFTQATDLAFSSAVTQPANFAACTYSPSAGYDPNVTFICLNPKGKMKGGTIAPSSFSLKFRAQVK
jgi:hypothetical protein